ncbi:MAG: hypothetical protein ACNS62_13950 [Candidatus Cyclobacteriaceae bacterium M3_2C_046]
MRKIYAIIPLGLFVLFICSCTKDELTKPADVTFKFTMNTEGSNQGKNLVFNEGTCAVSSIIFDGTREDGQDYYFNVDFEQPVIAFLHSGTTSDKLEFNVPQGVYEDIDLEVKLGSQQEGLTFKGFYYDVHNREIPVIFEYNFNDKLDLKGKDKEKNKKNKPKANEVVIKKDQINNAEIFFDQYEMFQVISQSRMLESADLVDVDGIPTIIISKDHNAVIFKNVVNRIERFTSALFQ